MEVHPYRIQPIKGVNCGLIPFQASDVVYAWNIMVTPVGGKLSTENTESTEDICCPALYEN